MPSISRQDRLYQELRKALQLTSAEDLAEWGRASASRLPKLAVRRVQNLGHLLSSIARFTGNEISDAVKAISEGRFGAHFERRAADGIDGTIMLADRVIQISTTMGAALFNDPKKNAPGVLSVALGFMVGSGGLDGNGGVPDTDLLMGIGAHRSLMTHSIVAGTLVEGAILAIADLSEVVCAKLPVEERDPFWSELLEAKSDIAQQLSVGASAGIAYHLGIDATLQPGAYHDLPISMPMEAHQTILAMNAAAEGLDAMAKEKTTGQQVVDNVKSAGESTGAFIADGAKKVLDFGRGIFNGPKA